MIPPMPRVETATERLAKHLASPTPPPAIVFVDGEEFIVCDSRDEGQAMFADTQKRETDWREISLMVYKPRHGSYLREKMVTR